MKKSIETENCLYPSLTIIVGTEINDKANYITMAWVGVFGLKTIAMAMNKNHYSNQGIKTNKTFSVNIPSAEMMEITDYLGIVSGKKIDKSRLFTNFYGVLKNAPMIQECPVNMECELTEIINQGSHEIFVGKIINTYCEDQYLTNEKVDLSKVNPLLFSFHDLGYWTLGKKIGKPWEIGKNYIKG
jgi:flavin reductase (DIM6/NTAB) family NADH-FMN oxidoreductase RutF